MAMKYYITYFYNVRFLDKNTLPISTAKWDPKWFHNNQSQGYVFKDKRGIYNGIRFDELSPYKLTHVGCGKNCKEDPASCSFKTAYSKYLHTLNFKDINMKIQALAQAFMQSQHTTELPDICLLVHEKSDNPCSERQPLIDWFKENGIDLIEFSND